MPLLTKSERESLDLILPTVKQTLAVLLSYGAFPPSTYDPEYPKYLRACQNFAAWFAVPVIKNVLMRALETYNELDAELLKAQETIADLEETLDAANRDLGFVPSVQIRINIGVDHETK